MPAPRTTKRETRVFLKTSPKGDLLFHKEGHAARKSTFSPALWSPHSHFQSLRFSFLLINLPCSHTTPQVLSFPNINGQVDNTFFIFTVSIIPAAQYLPTLLFMLPFQALYIPAITHGTVPLPDHCTMNFQLNTG